MNSKKRLNSKQTYNKDQHLKIFLIIEEIKKAQYKLCPKLGNSKVDSLFNILTNISLLHNQILQGPQNSSDHSQYSRIIQLNRANLEKSIGYFFKTNFNLNLNDSSDDTHDSLTLDHKNNSTNSSISGVDQPKQKKREVLIAKIKNQMKKNKKAALVDNRPTPSNSQSNFTSSIEKKKRMIFRTVNHSPIRNIKPPNLNYQSKPDLSMVKSNSITSYYIAKSKEKRYKTHSMTLKTENKPISNSRQAKLYITYQSYPSFDQFCEDDPQCKEIAKPSNYAKSLLKKYKNVVEIYGKELKHSVNTSQTRRGSFCLKNEDKDYTIPTSTPTLEMKMKSNSFMKITKMLLKK